MLSPSTAFPFRRPSCPYCGHTIDDWPRSSSLQACRMCRRPLVLLRSPRNWNGPKYLRGLLDIGVIFYAWGSIVLMAAFALTHMPTRAFIHLFAILLFIIGSALGVDGWLGLRTGIDRTGRRTRVNGPARILALVKLGIGSIALGMVAFGLSL